MLRVGRHQRVGDLIELLYVRTDLRRDQRSQGAGKGAIGGGGIAG